MVAGAYGRQHWGVCVIQNAGGLPGQILRFDQNYDTMSGRDITEF